MMARSTTRSNQRPDTLMQDRHRQFDEIFLQRTAGPYIRVNRVTLAVSRSLPVYTQLRTCRRAAITDAMCQTRKSLLACFHQALQEGASPNGRRVGIRIVTFRGLLRLHSRYDPPDCSTAQSGLCHEAPA